MTKITGRMKYRKKETWNVKQLKTKDNLGMKFKQKNDKGIEIKKVKRRKKARMKDIQNDEKQWRIKRKTRQKKNIANNPEENVKGNKNRIMKEKN